MKGEKMNSELNIGDLVRKRSGRTFKSGNKAEQIVEFTVNSKTDKPAVRLSDDSIVDLYILRLAQSKDEQARKI
jgi:hypothetical protein